MGDRQSSHPVKNPASVLWQVIARCCLPRSPGQPQHLKYQNWILKMCSGHVTVNYACRRIKRTKKNSRRRSIATGSFALTLHFALLGEGKLHPLHEQENYVVTQGRSRSFEITPISK